jgi:hypothetical protein
MDNANIKYKGVNGWLLLLCINLTILDPFAMLFNLVSITYFVKPHFDNFPALINLMLISGSCGLAIMVFSVYSGISLWKMLPNAVSTVKKYFFVVFFYSLFSVVLPSLVGLPEKAQVDFSANTAFNSLITVLYIAVWYIYLNRSKRVKATYGTGKGHEISNAQ